MGWMNNVEKVDSTREYAVVVTHPDIGVILEEADIPEPWRALPFIYESYIEDPFIQVDEILRRILQSGTYNHVGYVPQQFHHDLHGFIEATINGILLHKYKIPKLTNGYVYEVVIIDPNTLAISFRTYY